MTAWSNRIGKRGSCCGWDKEAGRDHLKIRFVKVTLSLPHDCAKASWRKVRRNAEWERYRKLSNMTDTNQALALGTKIPELRRATVQWYCGTFSILKGEPQLTTRAEVTSRRAQLSPLLTRTKWTRTEETLVLDGLKLLIKIHSTTLSAERSRN